ncbi:hypothetical protein HHI36_016651 [Cryptolaemus montrouzieri]|uniref:Uncharacterized protein n=1 Tax=Cryptolaemus montrouzieri TaxID=559131 RepID=A0ABD2NL59_9CUCU
MDTKRCAGKVFGSMNGVKDSPVHMGEIGSRSKGAIPKRSRKDDLMQRQISSPPFLDGCTDGDLERYMKNMDRISRRSLHDEAFRTVLKSSLAVPVCSNLRRHSCNDTDVVLERTRPLSVSPSRKNSNVRRSVSSVSTRSRRDSKYPNGIERKPSFLTGSVNGDFSLIVEQNYPTIEAYRKELRRRRIVWLVIGMFFFILAVSVLIVVITLTHRIDVYDRKKTNQSSCV